MSLVVEYSHGNNSTVVERNVTHPFYERLHSEVKTLQCTLETRDCQLFGMSRDWIIAYNNRG